jgi:hypothetical protein
MKGFTFSLITVAMLALLAFPADIQAGVRGKRTPGIDHHQARQHLRIAQGMLSGALTAGETRVLRSEQLRIRRHERLAKADGVVTPHERARLRAELGAANRHIYRLKHNPRHR